MVQKLRIGCDSEILKSASLTVKTVERSGKGTITGGGGGVCIIGKEMKNV